MDPTDRPAVERGRPFLSPRHRWGRPLITLVSVVGGAIGGFFSAVAAWGLTVDQDPQSEAGAVGLIWLFSLITIPIAVVAIRSILFRVFLRRE